MCDNKCRAKNVMFHELAGVASTKKNHRRRSIVQELLQ